MANGRAGSKKHGVSVNGPWFPMPLDFLRGRACAELSPHAVKMLIDLCAMLGPNATGNGDLSATPAFMKPRGWVSNATRIAALLELQAAGLLVITRRGNRRSPTLYAITLWPLHCDLAKLEYGPGSFTSTDWQKGLPARARKPTMEAPAIWGQSRKGEKKVAAGEKSGPAAGKPTPVMTPQRDNPKASTMDCVPAAGSIAAILAPELVPQRDTFLDSPSALAGCSAVGGGLPGMADDSVAIKPEGQQAAIVASAQDWASAHKQGGTGANQHTGQTGNVAGLQTVAQRAAESGASERTQRMADKVAKADPALAVQVGHGEVSLPQARLGA